MSTIHIAAAIDDNYVQHLGVMLCSLFTNCKNDIHVHVLHENVNSQSIQALQSVVNCKPITFYNVHLNNPNDFYISGHITLGAYLRILIPQYINIDETNKILYLDSDIIIKKDITPLWQIDISRYAVAAAVDVTLNRQKELGYDVKFPYFNSGVLLINLKKWREENVMHKILTFVKQFPEKILFHDQDALNAVLYDKWLPLHPKYNMQGQLFMNEFDHYNGDLKELQEAISSPVIIHFSAPLKPWHYLSYHPYTSEYYKYLSLTPWKGYKPTDKNWIRVMRKAVRPYLKKIGIKKVLGKHLY